MVPRQVCPTGLWADLHNFTAGVATVDGPMRSRATTNCAQARINIGNRVKIMSPTLRYTMLWAVSAPVCPTQHSRQVLNQLKFRNPVSMILKILSGQSDLRNSSDPPRGESSRTSSSSRCSALIGVEAGRISPYDEDQALRRPYQVRQIACFQLAARCTVLQLTCYRKPSKIKVVFAADPVTTEPGQDEKSQGKPHPWRMALPHVQSL